MMPRLAAALVAALALHASTASAARAPALAAEAFAAATPAAAPAPWRSAEASSPAPRVAAGDSASPFPAVPLEPVEPPRSHRGAWLVLAAGAGLVGASFLVAESADQAYADYLAATDPSEIESLYDTTVRRDRIAAASLIAGEVLVATAVWMRFLREPPASRVSLRLGPGRCALALRY